MSDIMSLFLSKEKRAAIIIGLTHNGFERGSKREVLDFSFGGYFIEESCRRNAPCSTVSKKPRKGSALGCESLNEVRTVG